jgi:AraC-like DNA-binding protein
VFEERQYPSADFASASLQPVVFTTDGEQPSRRFDAWRSHYESFNYIDIDPQDCAGFTAKNEIWSLGDIALSRNIGPRNVFTRTTRHVRRDSIDHWVIRVASMGVTRYQTDSCSFVTRPNLPFVFSLADASLSERSHADWLSLYIPRDSFPEIAATLDQIGMGPLNTPMASLLAEYLMLLEKQMKTMTAADVPALVDATRAMVSACLARSVDSRTSPLSTVEIARRDRIRQIIANQLGLPDFGPEQLCELAGVSRSQLYRMFEPHGGVARYIQQRRLRTAHALLSNPGDRNNIRAIAEQVGFSDMSAFSRAFRREFRYSPSEARSSVKREIAAPNERRVPLTTGEFSAVLRRLGTGSR